MKIVVVGNGKVGSLLTKMLCEEGHDVVVVDRSEKPLIDLQNVLDVAVVVGDGLAVKTLEEAGVSECDFLISVTPKDETNLLCCNIAKMLGCRHTAARVRDPQFDEQIDFMRSHMGISMIINPEKLAAREIFRLLQYPGFIKRDSFASDRVELVEWKITDNSVLADKRLDEVSSILKGNGLICVVDHRGKITIPSGSFKLSAADTLTVAVAHSNLASSAKMCRLTQREVHNVMIMGGSIISVYLAKDLIADKIHVKIIEQDQEKCERLSEVLPQAEIICANGTDQEVLFSEGLSGMDAFVSLTGIDEENLIVSMLAKTMGVSKTITKISHIEYASLLKSADVDTIVSPRYLIANEIVRYVRAIHAAEIYSGRINGTIDTLYKIADGNAEAISFVVPAGAPYCGITMAKLHIKADILVASIIREKEVIIPKGDDFFNAGDLVVIVVTAGRTIESLSEIFETGVFEK